MLLVLAVFLWGLPTLSLGQPGSLQGWVWFDENANGLREQNESPLVGWPVQLQDGRQRLTQADGSYIFAQLPPGEYTLSQAHVNGWKQSFPQSQSADSAPLQWGGFLIAEDPGTVVTEVVESDPNGGVVLGGTFTGTVDLDPGEGVSLHSDKGVGAFVVKLNAEGWLEWSRVTSVGPSGRLAGIAQDANGLYVVGHFSSATLDFTPPSQDDALGNPGFYSLFVTHFKHDGTHGWTRVMGGAQSMTLGNDLASDGCGGLYVTGSFTQTVDFDPGPGIHNRQAGDNALFLLKLESHTGLMEWVRTSRGLTAARGIRVEADPVRNTVLLTGAYRTYIDLTWGDGQAHLQSHGDWDTFAACVTGEGNLTWTRTLSGSYSILPYDSALDRAGNLYVTGMYTGLVDFDPSMDQDLLHYTNEAMGQSFLWKLDPNGTYQWTQPYGDDQVATAGTGVTVDAMGRVTCVGERTDAHSDPNIGATSVLFLAVYGEQGDLLSVRTILDLHPADVSDSWLYSFRPQLWRVASHPNGAVTVTGPLSGCVDLDPGLNEAFHCTQEGAIDSFLIRLGAFQDAAAWTVQLEPGRTLGGLDFASYPVDTD
jgi:hypothetical protein